MDIFDILTLIGGLCLFLFGMNVMGDGLERRAGGGLKLLLGKLTNNRMKGFLTGLGVTAVIQSSSATTVMVVGFVNSGLMTLKQSIGVIMGANIGTTVTAWILSLGGISSSNVFVQLLKPTSFTPVLALAGMILLMTGKTDKKKDTGTKIRWRPDLDVFTDINVSAEYFVEMIKRQAIVNAGVTFIFRNQNGKEFEEQRFNYVNGITDHVQEIVGEDGLTAVQSWSAEKMARDRQDKPEYKTKINIAFAFSNRVSLTEYYHNSSWLEYGGAPDKAVRNAFKYSINQYLKTNNKYNKNESQIKDEDVLDCLVVVVSSFSSVTSYENQTKKAINNKGIQDAMVDMFRHNLEIYFIENPLDAEKIANQVLINKRSRENAEKTRANLKKKLTSTMDMTNRVAKFVDCRSKDNSEREIFIVEGDSALGACKQARNPDFQAIMPIRGKILNCLKADYSKIFKSEIITDLMKVLGCGVQVSSKANKDIANFDINLLRWNKVIICTDADVDGFQIRTLLLTMIYRLTPDLIEAGKVFIAESPLYEITTKKNVYFAYNEKEKEKFINEIGSERFTIQRSKGLGENEPDMMNLTTMNPATRRLIEVLPDDAERTSQMFDILLGDNLSGRKQYIVDHGAEYTDSLDLS